MGRDIEVFEPDGPLDDLPPVDREMVKASREAFLRGDYEFAEDMLRRLGGEPTSQR